MHVALLNQYYWPHGSATAQLLTELGEGLAARGHRVTAVTARVDAGGAPAPLSESRRGVTIARVPATRLGKARIVDRLVDYGTFYAGAFARLLTLRPAPDVVLALTTPPLIAATAQLAGVARRFRTVCVVQDVYPDIAVALGVVGPRSPVARGWRAANAASLRSAAHVVVLSEPMRARVAAYGVPVARLSVIPNWALAELDARASGDAMRLRYGFGDRFVVMYSGNMGAGHDFDALIGAAERLSGREDVVFAFVGDGVRRSELARAAERLSNVRLFDYASRDELADSLAAADVHAVTMRAGMEGLMMPSKVYGVLAAARPLLFVGPPRSAVADLVREARCGEVLSLGDPDGVARAIAAVADAPDRGRAAGERARRHLDERLAREDAISSYEELLTGGSRSIPASSRRSDAAGEARSR